MARVTARRAGETRGAANVLPASELDVGKQVRARARRRLAACPSFETNLSIGEAWNNVTAGCLMGSRQVVKSGQVLRIRTRKGNVPVAATIDRGQTSWSSGGYHFFVSVGGKLEAVRVVLTGGYAIVSDCPSL